MIYLHRLGIVFGVSLGSIGLSTASMAAVVYIDFGNAAGSEGGNWNTVTPDGTGFTDMVDWNTGLSLPWELDLSFVSNSSASDAAFSGWDTSTPGNWAGAASGNDGFIVDENGFSARISSMDPTVMYTVDIIAYATNPPAFSTEDISIATLFADSDARGLGLDGSDYDPLSAGANGNWLTYNNVVVGGGVGPGAPGEFSVKFRSTSGPLTDNIVVSAIRITSNPVPAPGAGMILGLGLMVGAAKRRR
jgi:hypothetical protein